MEQFLQFTGLGGGHLEGLILIHRVSSLVFQPPHDTWQPAGGTGSLRGPHGPESGMQMEWTHCNRALVSLACWSPQIKICLRVCWQAEGTDNFRQCHGDMVHELRGGGQQAHTFVHPVFVAHEANQCRLWANTELALGSALSWSSVRYRGRPATLTPNIFKEPKELLILLVISVNIYCLRNLNREFFKIMEPFHINVK